MIENYEFTFVRISQGDDRRGVIDQFFLMRCEPGSLFVVSVDKPFEAILSDDQTAVWATGTVKPLLVTVAGVKRGN